MSVRIVRHLGRPGSGAARAQRIQIHPTYSQNSIDKAYLEEIGASEKISNIDPCSGNEAVVLRACSAALLVFLARAARARIIAADLGSAADDLLDWLEIAGARHARLLQFATLLALESLFEFIY